MQTTMVRRLPRTHSREVPEKGARGHIGNMIGWFSRRYTDSEQHNPNNLRGRPYYCAYRDRFERVKDSRTKTWSYKPTD